MRMGIFWIASILAVGGIYVGSTVGRTLSIPDTSHYIEFVAKGTPNFLKIVGRSQNNCMGVVNNGKGKIHCRLSALDTGIQLRNSHMLKYLDASNHPMVSLAFEAKDNKFRGILELKGIRREVEGKFSDDPLKLEFTVNIDEFGIERPVYLGIGIEPDIRITAGLQ